jgi:hypothetical protein
MDWNLGYGIWNRMEWDFKSVTSICLINKLKDLWLELQTSQVNSGDLT